MTFGSTKTKNPPHTGVDFLFWYGHSVEGESNESNATRVSVAADGLTEANLNFAMGKMQIDSPRLHHEKSLFCLLTKGTFLMISVPVRTGDISSI